MNESFSSANSMDPASPMDRDRQVRMTMENQGMDLFEDFIILEDKPKGICNVPMEEDLKKRVRFEPFAGIGPRRYIDLFSMVTGTGNPIKRKDKKTGKPVEW